MPFMVDTHAKGGAGENYLQVGSDKMQQIHLHGLLGPWKCSAKDDILLMQHLRGRTKAPTAQDPRPLLRYTHAAVFVTNGNKHLDLECFRTALETQHSVPGKTAQMEDVQPFPVLLLSIK
jgi:hypothetical protein